MVASTYTVDTLSPGTYRITATDNEDPSIGCNSTTQVTVEDSVLNFNLTLDSIDITPNTNCNPVNGAIAINSVSVNGMEKDANYFNLAWVHPAGNTLDSLPNIVNQQAGTYRVTITDSLSCQSDTFDIEIEDGSAVPIPVLSQVAEDTYCSPGNEGSGILDIQVQESDTLIKSGYSYTWYRGDAATAGNELTGSLQATADTVEGYGFSRYNGLADGIYTIIVTDTSGTNENCTSTSSIEVTNDPLNISLEAEDYSIFGNNNCEEDFNGAIEILSVREGNDSVSVANFTFTWFDSTGASVTTNLSSSNGSTNNRVDSLAAGTYSVSIESDITGCTTSANIALEVSDSSLVPIVVFTEVEPSSYCNSTTDGDGILSVGVNEGGGSITASNYSFEWYRGADVSTPLVGSGSATQVNDTAYSGLSAGQYTIVVTDTNDPYRNCSATSTFTLDSRQDEIFVLDTAFSTTKNIYCSGTNGTGSITIEEVIENGVANDITNYSFLWRNESEDTITTNISGGMVDSLLGGTYEVYVTNNVKGCTEPESFSITVLDSLTNPDIEFSVTANNGCDNTLANVPNGNIVATASYGGSNFGGTSRFNFGWFEGLNPTNSITGQDSISSGANDYQATLYGLDSGNYTVRVQDNVTGCSANFTTLVDEVLSFPVVVIPTARITNNTICAGTANGSIALENVDVTDSTLSKYTIQWFDDLSAAATLTQQFGDANFGTRNNLETGDYYVSVTDTLTGCTSAPAVAIIQDFSTNPFISVTTKENIGCNSPANGAIKAQIDSAATLPSFITLSWFDGSDTSATNLIVTGSTDSIANLGGDFYTILATNDTSGCSAMLTVELDTAAFYPVVTAATQQASTLCSTPNGSAAFSTINYNGASESLSDFTFTWYNGASSNNDIIGTANGSQSSQANLGAGRYDVLITHVASGCETQEVYTFEIGDSTVAPSIQFELLSADTRCDDAAVPNGAISATADGDEGTNHSFAWFIGADTTGTRLSDTDNSVDSLSAATYTLLATNNTTGCAAEEQFVLEKSNEDVYRIDSIVTVAQTFCIPANGSVEILRTSIGDVADYQYFIYDTLPSLTTPFDTITAAGVFEGLAAGNYYIEGRHINTLCETKLVVEAFVADSTLRPTVRIDTTLSIGNILCNTAEGLGALAIDTSELNLISEGNVSYQWSTVDGSTVEPIAGATTSGITELLTGFYQADVTDGVSGCVTSEVIEVPALNIFHDGIRIVSTSSDDIFCFDDIGSGVAFAQAILLNESQVDGTLTNIYGEDRPLTDVNYAWYEGLVDDSNISTAVFLEDSAVMNELKAGIYTVRTQAEYDENCYAYDTVTIKDATSPPMFEIDTLLKLTTCNPSNPNGKAQTSFGVDTGDDVVPVNVIWLQGSGSELNTADTVSQFAIATGLANTPYTVVVENQITGCTAEQTFTIPADLPVVLVPDLSLKNNNTKCDLENPNGKVVAFSNDTETLDFNWYNAIDTTLIAEGVDSLSNLSVGTYIVQAVERLSECPSEFSDPVEIALDTITPIIGIRTVNSGCFTLFSNGNPLSGYNGFANVDFITPNKSLAFQGATWYKKDEFGDVLLTSSQDAAIGDLSPGQYRLDVVDNDGCKGSAEFDIKGDILVYNAISDNGDDLNAYMRIECIEDFPSSTVKIFNRAGILVWENLENGTRFQYQNQVGNQSFSGISNRIGTGALPEGTYFYIVEKGDDSDPIQGYLELVR